jgi:hypothetical protein
MRSEAIFDRYRFDSEIHRQLKVLSRQPAINTMITTALSTNKLSFKAVSDLESTAEQQASSQADNQTAACEERRKRYF